MKRDSTRQFSSRTAFAIYRTFRGFRIRHFRGHGVHSPFAYRMVREVYMKVGKAYKNNDLYDRLIGAGVSKWTARFIDRLYDHLGCNTCELDGELLRENDTAREIKRLVLLSPQLGESETSQLIEASASDGDPVGLLLPLANIARHNVCASVATVHSGMCIDCREVVLLFNDKGLNREYIKL